MAAATTVTSPSAPSTSSGLPPHHSKSSSAPPSAAAPGNLTSSAIVNATPATEHVAECSYEFLLAAILQWVERDEKRIAGESNRVRKAMQKMNIGDKKQKRPDSSNRSAPQPRGKEDGSNKVEDEDDDATSSSNNDDATATAVAAAAVMAAERSAARIERMGYDVGYRLCERLAQHRPLLGPGSPSPETDAAGSNATTVGSTTNETVGKNPIIMGGGGHNTIMDPKSKRTYIYFLFVDFTMYNIMSIVRLWMFSSSFCAS